MHRRLLRRTLNAVRNYGERSRFLPVCSELPWVDYAFWVICFFIKPFMNGVRSEANEARRREVQEVEHRMQKKLEETTKQKDHELDNLRREKDKEAQEHGKSIEIKVCQRPYFFKNSSFDGNT